MDNIDIDVRVYPIEDPRGNTLAFASAGFSVDGEDLIAIRGIRVVDSEKGLFVAMPQSKDRDGEYHDVAFPLNGDLRKELNMAILDEYDAAVSVDRKHGIGEKMNRGAEKAAKHAAQRAAQPRAASKSRAGGR